MDFEKLSIWLTVAEVFKKFSKCLYLSLFFSHFSFFRFHNLLQYILYITYYFIFISPFHLEFSYLHASYHALFSLKGRNRRSGVGTLCDDAFNLQDALNNCRRNGGLPSYTTKCKVEVESCAWFVDCPDLSNIIFRGGQSHHRANQYVLSVKIDREVTCGMTHRNWAFVCCGHYCD